MKKLTIIILLFFTFMSNLYAKDNKNFIKSAFFNYENDSVFGSDRYYSNGIQFSFITKDFIEKKTNILKIFLI